MVTQIKTYQAAGAVATNRFRGSNHFIVHKNIENILQENHFETVKAEQLTIHVYISIPVACGFIYSIHPSNLYTFHVPINA